MDPESGSRVQRPVRTTNGTTLALIGGLIVLVLVIAYFATRGNSNQDKLTENEVTQNATKAKALAPEKLCASNQTYDLIKRELFRRAAQLRGSDQAAFDQLSAYAVVRMENPVMESQDNASGAVNCSGNLSLDLPPGVRIVGGRQTLTSDVDYTVQAAADGSGKIVLLRSADAVIAPLATLARANQQAQISTATAPAPELANEVGSDQQQLDVRTQRQPATVPSPNVSSAAHPSFDCAKARSKGEVAVCSDAGLTALDRNVADQYGRAMSGASAAQKALLRETGDRFFRYRDRCPNRSCIGDAYVGRMREIRDIMEGRWQPPR